MKEIKTDNNKYSFGMFSRMLAALFALVVSALVILSVSLLRNASNQFDAFRLENTQSITRTLAEGSLDALITEDYEILERFVKSSLPPRFGAYAYLTRPNGQILSSTDLSLVATKITLPDFTTTEISRRLTFNSRPVIEVAVKANIGNKHLATAHVAYYIDEGNYNYFGQAREIIVALVTLLFVILAGTYFIVSRIRTPVIELIETILNTSHDTPFHLPQSVSNRKDEVGTLARSFDDVFTRLSVANDKVISAKNNLELEVLQRTREIIDKNIELEAAQHRIKTIMDNAADSIISINDKGLIESFNIAAQKLFGYTFDEVKGKNVNMLMPEPDHSKHDNYLKRYDKSGSFNRIDKGPREVTGKRKNNSEFAMELQVSHIESHGDTIFVGIVRDITLEKEAKDSLLRSNEVLEEKVKERTLELNNINEELVHTRDAALEASNLKSEFLSNISHELRTPLHAISGYESLLSMSELSEKQSDYCNKIHSGAQNLLEIISDILDFSAFETGELNITSENVSIADTLHDICNMFTQSASQKQLDLSFYVEKNVPDLIATDPKRLRQVIVHLISNAIKFTEKGSIKIEAALGATQDSYEKEESPLLHINIIDTGIGIDEKEFKRIFTPFYQVDGSVTRSYGGTGLGLAMSNKIIKLMGGEIVVNSTPKQGTRFTILLPLVLESNDDALNNTDKNVSQPTKRDSIKPDLINLDINPDMKVIVVEDDDINADLLILLLEDIGIVPDRATNGKVFLDMTKKNHYDLILMDCQMPVMNGYEATKEYRNSDKNGTHTPIIAITANAMPGDKEKCLASGMDDYIAKPVKPEILKETINHWIN